MTDEPMPPGDDVSKAEGRGWRGRGRWGERGGWGDGRGWGGARRRPPWWPEGEAWPPQTPEGWKSLRRGFIRRAAFFAALVLALLVLVVIGIVWLVSELFGANAVGVVVAIGVLLVGLLVARGVVRSIRLAAMPLGDLIEASARVEAGDYGRQVAERGPRELRAMARAFNAMSARLAETDRERRRLLADVSHELRTPLTVIQGNVEGILDGLYPADRGQLERILAETQTLERLIDDLRTLSMAEVGALALHREVADLGALADEVVAVFGAQAAAAGVTLRTEVARGATDEQGHELEIDPRRMRQVITNLVSNALRHTPRGGLVAVGVEAGEDGRVVLTVRDSGSGMEPEAVAHAFNRFWRSPDSPGSGLGLPIARDLVQAHGGEIAIESSPGQGTAVRVTLPRHGNR